jgi:hypothetical protein
MTDTILASDPGRDKGLREPARGPGGGRPDAVNLSDRAAPIRFVESVTLPNTAALLGNPLRLDGDRRTLSTRTRALAILSPSTV